jgi:exodeoxyribonuclease VII large subunit
MQEYSLSEFNDVVKAILKKNLEPSYWIVAEIGEMNVNQKGHCYLELVEKKDNYIVAKNKGTIWAYTYSNLSNYFATMAGTPLQSGMKVLINAALQYHEVYGLSLNIKDIDPNFTIGERERKKQETIKQLEVDGILDMNKQVPLPFVPQNIAVISSESAAGYGDFMHQITNNGYGYKVQSKLFNAIMQGDTAPESIIGALHEVYENESAYDLVVIIRGGGAQTDMDCFDDYNLCTHIAQFPLPIVTGIGHERDNTIADIVANTKMKTPTAVAEFIINGIGHFDSKMNVAYERIANLATDMMYSAKEKLNELNFSIKLALQRQIQNQHKTIADFEAIIKIKPALILGNAQNKLALFEKTINASDPKLILQKGFTITTVNGKVLSKNGKPKKGDAVKTTSKNHTFVSTIN